MATFEEKYYELQKECEQLKSSLKKYEESKQNDTDPNKLGYVSSSASTSEVGQFCHRPGRRPKKNFWDRELWNLKYDSIDRAEGEKKILSDREINKI